MESVKNSCSVIQYHKGADTDRANPEEKISSIESHSPKEADLIKVLHENNVNSAKEEPSNQNDDKGESIVDYSNDEEKVEKVNASLESPNLNKTSAMVEDMDPILECDFSKNISKDIELDLEAVKSPSIIDNSLEKFEKDESSKLLEEGNNEKLNNIESVRTTRGRKRKLSNSTVENESTNVSNADAVDETGESEMDGEKQADTPRRRGRKKGKKTPEVIPSHLSSDMVLGYKMLVRFLETPQFSGFHKPFKKGTGIEEDNKITCLNQIKKKFEENSYKVVSEFVNDVREMLTNTYESRNPVAIKRALRLEQVLEQKIAQLPNYLRPQCALVLPPDEVNNSHNKIRISKGGGFVSLLLEKTEKQRYEKNREKRKLLAEERKQLKEEQNKDVQEWEKNVLLKNYEEEIKSMWELPAIGHFIHLCADILNIGEVAQFEVERMLLMPQCSDTLDLIMTALLTNSLVRAKLDRTPSMPYSIWGPLVRTRVMSWYRIWHKEGRNEQKLFEEIGIEPVFWQILGPNFNPLDYYYFHEISLLQRVWILKTLCDVDFIRKKTVHDNIRVQALDELSPIDLGIDRHGNRYIQLKQFCASDIRVYRQSTCLEGDVTMSEFVGSFEGFEHREGPITADKVFRDIWELGERVEVKVRKKKTLKAKKKNYPKVAPDSCEKKNLRRSARAKQKTYVDWSDSDQSDTDLVTLKKKLTAPETETLYKPFSDKEFISLSVFRLPRDKVSKPTSKRGGYASKRTDDTSRNDGTPLDKTIKIEAEGGKDAKPGVDDEQSDSLDAKQMQDMQVDFEKTFQSDDLNGDEFDFKDKLSGLSLNKVNDDVKFTVKNLEDLKMVFKKGPTGEDSEETGEGDANNIKVEDKTSSLEKEYDSLYKYNVPSHLKPDSSKFYLVVDSVEGLRQLISKFGSHENDLEIITRSTKSKKKSCQTNRSAEIQLIEKLQNLLVELEPWEIDFIKSYRSNKEKMYKEYMSFISRPPDFVHPNEAYWMKTCEEPTTTVATTVTATTTTTTSAINTGDLNTTSGEKSNAKETTVSAGEGIGNNQQDLSIDGLIPRRRTRVTRVQLQPEDNDDLDEDFDDGDDYESNESDDNWVLPTSKRKAKKETPVRTTRFSRRSAGRKPKSSPVEKSETSSTLLEKTTSSSPEKSKKTLFWGPRSSDPSEDLNWEKNRQKILEKHNSPVKKAYRTDASNNEMSDLANVMQKTENPSTSVITSSPKRLSTPIPGNKKPYFSSAQLKAMENQTILGKSEENKLMQTKTVVKASNVLITTQQTATNTMSSSIPTEVVVFESGNKHPVKIQTYSRLNKPIPKQTLIRTPQAGNKPRVPPPKHVIVSTGSRADSSNLSVSQPVKFTPQLRGSVPGSTVLQKLTNVEVDPSGNLIQTKGITQGQIQQPVARIQQIQIQQPSGQVSQVKGIATSVASVRLQQPVHWQPKVITVQSVNQQGKIVQQQVQTQSQAEVQGQPQVQLQNQSQVQGQIQQVIHLEPQKWTTIQQPLQVGSESLNNVQQVVISPVQGSTTPGTSTKDNDLYVTDGKVLIKFDNNFVQQYLQKDKVVTLNLNEKLDMKKPLLIVKPKTDANTTTNQGQSEPSTSQQNVVVFNKPTVVQQTVVPNSVSNFVIPSNYIVKEESQVSQQGGQQTVKILQQAPAYIIQQKPVSGKTPQPQIIKIITSQPMSGNQNLILSPASISMGGQVLRPVTQTVFSSDQQSKSPPTLRFLRPQIASSNSSNSSQNKISTLQNPIIVNNLVQIQGQQLDTSKPQMVAGKIVSTGVPSVRMTAPGHTIISSSSMNQALKVNAQPLKVIATTQSQGQTQTIVSSATLNSQAVKASNINAVRLASNAQHQSVLASGNSNIHSVGTTTTVNALPVRVVTSGQPPQTVVAQAVVANTQSVPSTNASTPTLRLNTNVPPIQVQPQTVVSSGNLIKTTTLNSQPVRLTAVGTSQPIKLIANNSVASRLIRNVVPGKTTVITSTAQPPGVIGSANVKPTGIAGQPVRLQTIVQSPGTPNTDSKLQSR